MRKLTSICVFCGSSEGNDIQIIETAKELNKEWTQYEGWQKNFIVLT